MAAQPPGRRRRTEPPHQHDPRPGEVADWNDRTRCAGCGLLGKAGDARHPAGALALADARRVAAAGNASRRLSAVAGDVHARDLAIRRRFDPGDGDD